MCLKKHMLQLPLAEPIEDFLNHLFDSPRTQHTYRNGLHCFQLFLTEAAGALPGGDANAPPVPLSFDKIDTNVLQEFQTWLGQHGYSRFSHKTYLAAVVAFLNYALSKDWLPVGFSLE